MQVDPHVPDIARVIQLAVAPVFLLSGVGVTLTVLTNRLARIIDRARYLQGNPAEVRKEDSDRELGVLGRRAALIHRAITLSTTCALVVCLVIIALFLAAFLDREFADVIAILFIVAMLAFVGALVSFLREIFLATHTLRFHPPQS